MLRKRVETLLSLTAWVIARQSITGALNQSASPNIWRDFKSRRESERFNLYFTHD